LPASAAFAEGDFSATIGLKMWNHTWSSWATAPEYVPNDYGYPIVRSSVNDVEAGNTQGWIPSFSVRYKDFMLGGSYFAKKSYDFSASANQRLYGGTPYGGIVGMRDVKREEFDLTAGYYVLPTLAIIGGYKEVDQWWGGDKYKYSGPIIGVSASAPLTSGFSLYGTVAVGPTMKLTRPNGGAKSDSDYRLGEVGLAYAFDVGGVAGIKSLIGTMGYRSQVIVTKMTGLTSDLKGRDTTEGLTLGVVAAF
jgi:hypothetical protein